MGILGVAKGWINRGLQPLGMRLDSLAAQHAEEARWRSLEASGQFDRPAYPVLRQFLECDPAPLIEAVRRFEPRFQELAAGADAASFRFDNDYYPSPDAEVLYAMARILEPARILEIGSGNSTVLFRHAITDGGFPCRLTSVDPFPRRDIAQHADEVFRSKLEDLTDPALFAALRANDILFVDSSHEIKAGNDVLKVFLTIVPPLAPGVLIHVHDVFLPYEYPRRWLVDNGWAFTEQYLLQALLQGSDDYDVIWCGYFLQRTRPGFLDNFKRRTHADAQSLWLRKRAPK